MMKNKNIYKNRTKVIEMDKFDESQKVILLQVVVMAATSTRPIAEITGLFSGKKPNITYFEFWEAYKEFSAAGQKFSEKVKGMIDLKERKVI